MTQIKVEQKPELRARFFCAGKSRSKKAVGVEEGRKGTVDPCGQLLSRWIQFCEGPPIFLHAVLRKACLSPWRERGWEGMFIYLLFKFIVAVESMFLFPPFLKLVSRNLEFWVSRITIIEE